MSADYIKMSIDSLGKDIASLIRAGTVPVAIKRIKAFPEDEGFYIKILKGVELEFYEPTGCLEAISITLIKMAPWSTIYIGGLPPPLQTFHEFPMDSGNLWGTIQVARTTVHAQADAVFRRLG